MDETGWSLDIEYSVHSYFSTNIVLQFAQSKIISPSKQVLWKSQILLKVGQEIQTQPPLSAQTQLNLPKHNYSVRA